MLRLVRTSDDDLMGAQPSQLEIERRRHSTIPKGVHIWVKILHIDKRIVVKCARCKHQKTIVVGELPSETERCEGEP